MGFREPLVGEARVRLSGTGQPDIYRSDWISISRQRHFHSEQPQHPDGEGGDQLPTQLSVSQPILDKLIDALDRTLDDDNVHRRLLDLGGAVYASELRSLLSQTAAALRDQFIRWQRDTSL